MASGAQLSAFLDFISGTGTGRLTDPAKPIQLVTQHTWLWGRLWKQNGMAMQGGKNMTFWYIPQGGGTFEETLPGTVTTPTNPQVLQTGVLDWRFTRAHSTYTKQEVMLNDRIRYGTRDSMFEQFVNIRDEKATLRHIDVAKGFENQLAAVPVAASMEGTATSGATSPYSIFAHINQDTTGLYGSGWTATGAVTAWTVKQNITPGALANNSNCAPKVSKYSSAAADNPANFFGGLDDLFMEISWEQPDSLSKYSSDETLSNLMLLTTKQGRRVAMSLMRGDQDRYVAGPQDPAYTDPQFHGIPMRRWDLLESAAVYDAASGTSKKTEGNAAGSHSAGPRVYAINGNFMYPICHDEVMFQTEEPMRHPHIPDTFVQYEETWWNLPCKSYKHQGILVPSANLYGVGGSAADLYT